MHKNFKGSQIWAEHIEFRKDDKQLVFNRQSWRNRTKSSLNSELTTIHHLHHIWWQVVNRFCPCETEEMTGKLRDSTNIWTSYPSTWTLSRALWNTTSKFNQWSLVLLDQLHFSKQTMQNKPPSFSNQTELKYIYYCCSFRHKPRFPTEKIVSYDQQLVLSTFPAKAAPKMHLSCITANDLSKHP